jgi:hypothetical protein
MTASVAILIPYFGDWPAWINFFVESCRANRTIDWIIVSDSDPPENRAPNISHVRTSFGDYKARISEALDIRFNPEQPYKLCDVRPALPLVHRELVGRYDFVGFGDLDVIYGDLRAFYDSEILSNYDLLSSHRNRVSGHLCLMRNTDETVTAFKRAPKWKRIFEQPENVGFDEAALFRVLTGSRAKASAWLGRKQPRGFFREAYSTPGPTDGMRWYWRDGMLTNEFYPHHPFMYLHFMSWHSNRWYADQPGVAADLPAPWSLLRQIVRMDWRDARKQGFMISPAGIEPIERSR